MPAEHMAGGGGLRSSQRPQTPQPRRSRPVLGEDHMAGERAVEIPAARQGERTPLVDETQDQAPPVGPEPVPPARRWGAASTAGGGGGGAARESGRERLTGERGSHGGHGTGRPAPGGTSGTGAGGTSAAAAQAGGGGAGAGGGVLAERGGNRPLDRIDRAILRLLQQDGRASIRSVAERVHVSRANAYARIARMMEDGVIRGFTARVDHERAGQGASAYVTLKIVQNSWRTVRGQLLELPGVEHIALVSGDFDVLMLVHTVDNRALRELVLNRIQSLPAVLSTHTLLVFDETDRIPVLPE
jgi:DNA-binding Lrp family transcriptional regulator